MNMKTEELIEQTHRQALSRRMEDKAGEIMNEGVDAWCAHRIAQRRRANNLLAMVAMLVPAAVAYCVVPESRYHGIETTVAQLDKEKTISMVSETYEQSQAQWI